MRDSEINKTDDFDYTFSIKEDGDIELSDGYFILNESTDTRGRHYKPFERNVAAARHIKAGTINKYYIKADSEGTFFDPMNISHRANSLRKRNGVPMFNMQEVKASQFKAYKEFLKTKERRFYVAARKDW